MTKPQQDIRDSLARSFRYRKIQKGERCLEELLAREFPEEHERMVADMASDGREYHKREEFGEGDPSNEEDEEVFS